VDGFDVGDFEAFIARRLAREWLCEPSGRQKALTFEAIL
jgi:hypothetical protein